MAALMDKLPSMAEVAKRQPTYFLYFSDSECLEQRKIQFRFFGHSWPFFFGLVAMVWRAFLTSEATLKNNY